MRIVSKISVDIRHPYICSRVDAVQNDVNTRAVEISLFDGGAAWTVPDGITAAVAYRKDDNTKGIYDKLPDGTSAVMVSGSVVTVILAQQMLTTPGQVNACIVLNDSDLNQLTTFSFVIRVAENPSADAKQSEDYIRLEWLERKLDEYLKIAKESGEFDGPPGPAGADGTGITILGSYDTEDALMAEHPIGEVGDSYLVSGCLYVWSKTKNQWENVGTIQGPKGEKGDTGDPGPQGQKGNTGASGYTPVRGTDYWTEADKAEIKAYVDNAILGGAW